MYESIRHHDSIAAAMAKLYFKGRTIRHGKIFSGYFKYESMRLAMISGDIRQ
jgi:hypothetical protein